MREIFELSHECLIARTVGLFNATVFGDIAFALWSQSQLYIQHCQKIWFSQYLGSLWFGLRGLSSMQFLRDSLASELTIPNSFCCAICHGKTHFFYSVGFPYGILNNKPKLGWLTSKHDEAYFNRFSDESMKKMNCLAFRIVCAASTAKSKAHNAAPPANSNLLHWTSWLNTVNHIHMLKLSSDPIMQRKSLKDRVISFSMGK